MIDFQNTILYLIGFPGTGKYTISKEICKNHDFILCDNHHVNNCLFPLVKADGKRDLPEGMWNNVKQVWDVVFNTILNLAEPEYNYIFTNYLNTDQDDYDHFNFMTDFAKKRGSTFIPIFLTCDIKTLKKRATNHERELRLKLVDRQKIDELINKNQLIDIKHPNAITLDITSLSPQESAKIILDHLLTLYKE